MQRGKEDGGGGGGLQIYPVHFQCEGEEHQDTHYLPERYKGGVWRGRGLSCLPVPICALPFRGDAKISKIFQTRSLLGWELLHLRSSNGTLS